MSDKTIPGPKRILALSGGGVRGIVEVAFLEAVEREYRNRFGSQTRLCDVFDLVGGTSTGALIATSLALGHPMERIANIYLERATRFFAKPKWYRFGRYSVLDSAQIEAEIRADVGDRTLGDADLQTYLAIILKRLDSGSPWVANNIPSAPYFEDPHDRSYRGNKHYSLSKLLRAATAAPTYFDPELIQIAKDEAPGLFIDGGLSPYGDPSIALLMLARMSQFGLNWRMGQDDLFILSLGTGKYRQRFGKARYFSNNPLRLALGALLGLAADSEHQALTLMEWMGQSTMPSVINSELGTLAQETLATEALFSYLRLDLPLERQPLRDAGFGLSDTLINSYRSMDDPAIIEPLYRLAQTYVAGMDLKPLLK